MPELAEKEPRAHVKIELSVEMENLSDFLSDWSQTVQKLIEYAAVESAKVELPASPHTIKLREW